MDYLELYLIGIPIACAILVFWAKKNAEDAGVWFAAKERIAFVSLLSWLVVIPCALYYMMDLGSRAYAILLFKYLLWKNKKNKR